MDCCKASSLLVEMLKCGLPQSLLLASEDVKNMDCRVRFLASPKLLLAMTVFLVYPQNFQHRHCKERILVYLPNFQHRHRKKGILVYPPNFQHRHCKERILVYPQNFQHRHCERSAAIQPLCTSKRINYLILII